MENLIGAVLCGGRSIRMGTDKGLIPKHEETWASVAINRLSHFDILVVLSINEAQQEKYKQKFPENKLIVDHDIQARGALQGLLSIHLEYPEKNILLLACDMQNMNSETIQNLLSVYIYEPDFDFYAYQHKMAFEPFCAIYTSNGLKPIKDLVDVHALQNFSFQHVLHAGKTKHIDIVDNSSFKNFNNPTDIE